MYFTALRKKHLHRHVLLLTLPMVFSSLTVPLLGLVDSAVIGHLDRAFYLAGVSLGNTCTLVLFFLLGFLRMATTGLNAQAYGRHDPQRQVSILLQGIFIALILSCFLLCFNFTLVKPLFHFIAASASIKFYAQQYFQLRLLASPAVLINLVIIGWLLGNQNATAPMSVLIFTNAINILLDLYFVLVLHLNVKGVAIASNCADASGLLLGLFFVYREWKKQHLPSIRHAMASIFSNITLFIGINRDIFLRNLFLQLVFAFMVFRGAHLGDQIAAANAILIGFLMLIAYAMDGFAYATEALVGKSIGEKNLQTLSEVLIVIFAWAFIVSLCLTCLFLLAGTPLIALITSLQKVQEEATQFLPWLIAFPLLSMWCFLLDGIFIGATRAKEMRNSMLLSSACFFLIALLFYDNGNNALWCAMLIFMVMRALSLGIIFKFLWRKRAFL